MAVESGYDRFACDRGENAHPDGKKPVEFFTAEDKARREWKTVPYENGDGIRREYLLCPYCATKYKYMKKDMDDEFNEFITEGLV